MKQLTKNDISEGLTQLGIKPGMALEVHSSLSSFGHVQGGAEDVINALKEAVGKEGTIVMPSFRLSENLPLSQDDLQLGLTSKIRILPEDAGHSAMGIVADTFRKCPGTLTGNGVFRVSAWGKEAARHCEGLGHLINHDGYALLLGVDIYRLSAMHYAEDAMPAEIRRRFKASEEARSRYPETEWLIEAWDPVEKPWYKIQALAYDHGLITDIPIGSAKCMFFKVKPVITLYRDALRCAPFDLYGIKPGTDS